MIVKFEVSNKNIPGVIDINVTESEKIRLHGKH